MNAEKKLYTTKEAMRIFGVTNNSGFFRKIKRHGIHPEKRSCFCYFTDEMIDDLKYNRSPGRPSRLKPEEKRPRKRKAAARRKKCPRYCWRVSVWNDEFMGYVVVKCGLTRKEADEFAAGKNAVKRPCWM
ncbi:hypothetical protein [uncultured Treponema sp.]|uniref:hypothetical protein n=1 Tax=uncultured Treponema sp. TaxID=162155 RepID=UPI00259A7A3C|nr:hypothetical protein [uncultured Treponema sp.]